MLSAPYHNGRAFIDPKLCARSPNGQSVATDFNGEITGLDDLDGFQTKGLSPAFDYVFLSCLNGRSARLPVYLADDVAVHESESESDVVDGARPGNEVP